MSVLAAYLDDNGTHVGLGCQDPSAAGRRIDGPPVGMTEKRKMRGTDGAGGGLWLFRRLRRG
jgi:hypothetical protein